MQYVDDMDDSAFSWILVLLPLGWLIALGVIGTYCPRRLRATVWYWFHLLGAVWLWGVSSFEPTVPHLVQLGVVIGLSGGIGGEILKGIPEDP
jgi:hypothetical protein